MIEEEPEEEKAYHSCDYGKTGKCAKEGKKEEEVSESDSSMSGKRFSEEIKDVLAALEDLNSKNQSNWYITRKGW